MPRPYMNSREHREETQSDEYKGYYDQSIHGLSQKDAEPAAADTKKEETKSSKTDAVSKAESVKQITE